MKSFAVLAVAIALAGAVNLPAQAKSPRATSPGNVTLSADEADTLQFLREEEKLARDVYITLHAQWGSNVFANISDSEQQHMDAIKVLLDKYGIDDPALPRVGEFNNDDLQGAYNVLVARGSQSLLEALRVGGFIEELDIGDLDDAIAATKRTDILNVYDSLQCGSGNHLRAFGGQLVNRTGAYEAQIMTQDEVDAILAADHERCGTN